MQQQSSEPLSSVSPPQSLASRLLRGLAAAAVISAAALVVVEIGLRLVGIGGGPRIPEFPPGYFARDANGIVEASPGDHRVVCRRRTGELIYQLIYSFDRFGRRITPVEAGPDRRGFLRVLGGSFAFGEGAATTETLPYRLGALTRQYVPYNYGFHGTGPFDALARLDAGNLPAEVPEPRGVGLYVYMDDHINRVNDSSKIAGWHSHEVYYRQRADGEFVRAGSFRSAHPWRTALYTLLYHSNLLRRLGLSLPLRTTSVHLDRTADALAAIHERFLATFPGSDFVVVMYPSSGYAADIGQRLRTRRVRSLDYSGLYDHRDARYRLAPENGHPTAAAHELIARAIVRDLGLE